ncbi:hypothetical protein K5V21_15380 [Clostridium sardiniense]|uniref:Uncharacterized protein n=1 Tax=Clostridium sardiniense TaxID=29369 RepID=A0ABS7L1A2_CLOSR|nr:hypothetical protein [Clostridium sardiniense]MBY0756825.1 hypothetical protein [Clostridium sardiniense]MDQ0458668.1 hypothetical protein [Clostridium sardiniense]
MQLKFELLNKGDSVVNAWDNKIAIKRKNGEVEIFSFDYDEDNLPRLLKQTILITYGTGSISVKSYDKNIEIGTF